MQRLALFSFVFLISTVGLAQEVPSDDDQIFLALKAAPEEQRTAATVYGYDAGGNLVLLREGSNDLICVADDPTREGFQVVAYHKDLQPFMDRGRELRAEGKTADEIFAIREQEAQAGTLQMPEQPTTLHLLEGGEVTLNPATGALNGAFYRYVVYIPFATAESTGLPLKPLVPGGPWIMNPGTHRAHIMITPPRETQVE